MHDMQAFYWDYYYYYYLDADMATNDNMTLIFKYETSYALILSYPLLMREFGEKSC